jgi:hypothetical protein
MQMKCLYPLGGWPARAYLKFLSAYFRRLAGTLEGPDGVFEEPSLASIRIADAIEKLATESGFPEKDTFLIPTVGRYILPHRPTDVKRLAEIASGFLSPTHAVIDYLDSGAPTIGLPNFPNSWYARACLPPGWLDNTEEMNSVALCWRDKGGNYSSVVFDGIARRSMTYDETKPGVVLRTMASQGVFLIFKFGGWAMFHLVPEENHPFIVNLDEPNDMFYFPEELQLPPKQ